MYYYNIPLASVITNDTNLTAQQKKDAILLKQAIPAYPAAYTMLFNNGVLQTQNDTDHATGVYIVNGDGIWWCNNTTSNTPWATGGQAVNLLLQTTKINPFYKEAVVTSLAPLVSTSNNSSSVISFIDKAAGVAASTGDLLLKFNLPVTTTSAITGTPVAVKSLEFKAETGALSITTGPAISGITAGPGLTVSAPDATTGIVQVAMDNYTLSGDVSDLEPEEADYVYLGLHSYLRIKNPAANQLIGFVGKFQLPQIIPTGLSLKIKLLTFSESNVATATFNFTYSISKIGSIGDTVYSGTYLTGANIAIPALIANTAKLIDYNTQAIPYFEIPAAKLVGSAYPAYVNFRIVRAFASGGSTANVNILGVTWAIE